MKKLRAVNIQLSAWDLHTLIRSAANQIQQGAQSGFGIGYTVQNGLDKINEIRKELDRLERFTKLRKKIK